MQNARKFKLGRDKMNFVNQRLKAVAFTKLSCMTLSYVIVAVLFAGMVGKPSISKASSYNVLVEETRNSNDIVSIYNYDTYADFRANNYSDLTETPINLNDLVSFSGLAYDGQYHAITEFVDDNAGSDFVTFSAPYQVTVDPRGHLVSILASRLSRRIFRRRLFSTGLIGQWPRQGAGDEQAEKADAQ